MQCQEAYSPHRNINNTELMEVEWHNECIESQWPDFCSPSPSLSRESSRNACYDFPLNVDEHLIVSSFISCIHIVIL